MEVHVVLWKSLFHTHTIVRINAFEFAKKTVLVNDRYEIALVMSGKYLF